MMKQQNVDFVLVYGNSAGTANINYLTQYLPRSPAWLIIPNEGESSLYVHFFNHLDNIRACSIINDVRWLGGKPVSTLVQHVQQMNPRPHRMGVIGLASSIPYGQFKEILDKTNLEVVDLSKDFLNHRIVKTNEEIEWHRKGAELTDLTFMALEKDLRPGLNEYEATTLIQQAYLPQGGFPGIHFVSATSMHEPDRQVPWQFPSARILEKGFVLNTEITATYWGYGSQAHRPFAVGEEPTALYKKLYEAAFEAYSKIAKTLRPGNTTKDIMEASDVIEEAGFTTCDSLVHGVAVTPPEMGTRNSVYPLPEMTLKENMVITIQPNPTTKDQKAGVQVGSTLIVRPNGGEDIHNYPFKFVVCK